MLAFIEQFSFQKYPPMVHVRLDLDLEFPIDVKLILIGLRSEEPQSIFSTPPNQLSDKWPCAVWSVLDLDLHVPKFRRSQ